MTTTLATWTIDPVHSSVEFSLDYMGFSTYRTGFRTLEGSLAFDADRPAASSVTASIPVASVDVTNDRLMSRLMDPDLLADGPREIDELARATESHAPSLRRVLLFLAGVGVLDKVGPQRFAPTIAS